MPNSGDKRYSMPEFDLQRLHSFMAEHAFKVGKFQLSSGKTSKYYFNSKMVVLSAEGAYLVARAMLEKIKTDDVDAVGGAALGAVPLAGALASLCFLEGLDHISFFVDRKEAKKHGDKRRVEGPDLKPGSRIIVVEDVVTTGSSALSTASYMREQGHEIIKVIAILDRKEGAAEAFKEENFVFDPIFTIDDFDLRK